MGSDVSRYFRSLDTKLERRILIVGLDGAGKTTLFYRLSTGSNVATTATVEPNCTDAQYGGLTFSFWDIGGGPSLRPYWRHHYLGTQGVVFVVDATDSKRIELAGAELRALAEDEQLGPVPIAVYANKCDQRGALPLADIRRQLGMDSWDSVGAPKRPQGALAPVPASGRAEQAVAGGEGASAAGGAGRASDCKPSAPDGSIDGTGTTGEGGRSVKLIRGAVLEGLGLKDMMDFFVENTKPLQLIGLASV